MLIGTDGWMQKPSSKSGAGDGVGGTNIFYWDRYT